MKVGVFHSFLRLTGKAGGVEVVDVAVFAVEDVEHIDCRTPRLAEFVAELRVHQRPQRSRRSAAKPGSPDLFRARQLWLLRVYNL